MTEKIFVFIQFDEEEIPVGELVSNAKNIFFKFYPEFIEKGIEISPFKLRLNPQIIRAEQDPFDGLFGVFADSLPDGWGRLLLDRAYSAKGIFIDDITVLDRLAHVGSNGMGALIYKPEIKEKNNSGALVDLDQIATATKKILSDKTTELLDELYQLGGSSGGARPKILVGFNPITNEIIPSEKTLPKNYEHWIIKFPSSSDQKDIGNIEYAYYRMALDAGIKMSESRLFKGNSGRFYFGTKRFDRVKNSRLHLHSAAGIMHDNFRLSTMDYGHLMDCAFKLERDVQAYEKILRLAAFNVFVHNRDDHSKNFAFLMDKTGEWKFAPAYDLTFSNSGHGMHSTTIANEGSNPTKKHLLELSDYFKIKNAKKIIDEVHDVTRHWKIYASECGVTSESTSRIEKAILRHR
jgi:serine/threonine-protein kinase HipA